MAARAQENVNKNRYPNILPSKYERKLMVFTIELRVDAWRDYSISIVVSIATLMLTMLTLT